MSKRSQEEAEAGAEGAEVPAEAPGTPERGTSGTQATPSTQSTQHVDQSQVTPQKKKKKVDQEDAAADPLQKSLVHLHLDTVIESVPLSDLQIDWDMAHGQSREVSRSHVDAIKKDVNESPPIEGHTITCWRHPGMPLCHYCVFPPFLYHPYTPLTNH